MGLGVPFRSGPSTARTGAKERLYRGTPLDRFWRRAVVGARRRDSAEDHKREPGPAVAGERGWRRLPDGRGALESRGGAQRRGASSVDVGAARDRVRRGTATLGGGFHRRASPDSNGCSAGTRCRQPPVVRLLARAAPRCRTNASRFGATGMHILPDYRSNSATATDANPTTALERKPHGSLVLG
jgi:hypothetical protein